MTNKGTSNGNSNGNRYSYSYSYSNDGYSNGNGLSLLVERLVTGLWGCEMMYLNIA
jgi:hypothetical protein